MPKSLEKENRGRVPKIGMAGGLRMCLLLFFRFCSGAVLCSHWSRGLGEREFPSLSFVNLAHGVPSATPLSAFSLIPLPCHLPARLFCLLRGRVSWVELINILTLWHGIGSWSSPCLLFPDYKIKVILTWAYSKAKPVYLNLEARWYCFLGNLASKEFLSPFWFYLFFFKRYLWLSTINISHLSRDPELIWAFSSIFHRW